VEEAPGGVHVGVVLPGFVVTEGFPQTELLARRLTRWTVATPAEAANAIFEVATTNELERYVPRGYALAAAARVLFPGLVRRLLSSKGAAIATPRSGADAPKGTNGPERSGAAPSSNQSRVAVPS
jgi:short-subunit dehydrogenase